MNYLYTNIRGIRKELKHFQLLIFVQQLKGQKVWFVENFAVILFLF